MDKKKVIILVCALVVVIVGVIIGGLFMKKGKDEDKVETTITLDINPSMELDLTKKGKVAKIRALNEEANDIIDKDMEGKALEEVFYAIVKNAKEHNYVEDGEVTIIVGLERDDKSISDKLREACNKNEINSNIIVPKITKEAQHEAEGYGVTPAKAAYILSIIDGNEELHFEDLKDKNSRELKEMKETGKYCEPGYVLRGDFCEKKSREEKPDEGRTCPDNYEEVNGSCVKTGPLKDEQYCDNGQTLKDGKCTGELPVNAKAKCNEGTYNSNSGKCETSNYLGEGTKSCNEAEDLLLSNGKCASHHMGAHFGEPDATIDPATECCCGDTYQNGWCYSLPNGNYDAKVTCPSGTYTDGDKGKGCYSVATSEATYSCDEGRLEGNKCMVNKETNPKVKHGCEEGYTLHEDRVCINTNETKEYVVGLVCKDDARLENEHCVYYEQVEPKTK